MSNDTIYWQQSEKEARKELETNPKDPDLNRLLITSLVYQDKKEEALEHASNLFYSDHKNDDFYTMCLSVLNEFAGAGRFSFIIRENKRFVDSGVDHEYMDLSFKEWQNTFEYPAPKPGDDTVNMDNPAKTEVNAREALRKYPNDLNSKYALSMALSQQGMLREALEHGRELYEIDPDEYRVTYALLLGHANVLERYDLIKEHKEIFKNSGFDDPEMAERFERALTPIEDNPFKRLQSNGATTVYSGFDDPKIVDPNCHSHQEGHSRLDACDGDDDRDLYPEPGF